MVRVAQLGRIGCRGRIIRLWAILLDNWERVLGVRCLLSCGLDFLKQKGAQHLYLVAFGSSLGTISHVFFAFHPGPISFI